MLGVRGLSTKVPRSPLFSVVTAKDIEVFKSVTPYVLTGSDAVAPFNRDWMGRYIGHSSVVVQPRTTAEVSTILKYCNERRVAVVPQGGNTGLVGGSVPVHDEIVLSLSRMNKVRSFDSQSGILVADAGCVLENLDNHVAQHGFIFPLDLGAKGSCQVGGNVSTNAGGLRLLRYGSLHGSVLGIEAVLASGEVVDVLSTLRKDNTGYDLKQLFIGSEGTLGVVTAVSVLTPPRPIARNVAVVGCDSFPDLIRTFTTARSRLSEILSAYEFVDRAALDLVFSQMPATKDPLSSVFPFYALIETSGSNHAHDMEKLEDFLNEVTKEGGPVRDGTVAQDERQMKELWKLRELVPVAFTQRGPVYKYDVSMPVTEMYRLVEETRERLKGTDTITSGYGHMGDGNVHVNVAAKAYTDEIIDRLEPWLFEWIRDVKGSVSAEHGLGQQKAHAIGYSKSPSVVALMGTLKKTFDPNGILNPYKVLPDGV